MKITRESARRLLPELSAIRQELHRYPELALQEVQTAQRVEQELDRLGIDHRRVGKTGVLGILRGEKPGKGIVALRADMDALAIEEQNDCPFKSRRPGVMHACGHDAHTTSLLGGAWLLSESRQDWGGEVRFIFQPAEETGQGTADFLAQGCMEGVDRVFGLHVAPDLPLGTVGLKPGLNNAAVDRFSIRVQGKSVHVSTPEQGVDALYIASHIVTALQAQVARRTSPVEPVILGIGMFHSGTTYNALAESAELEGTTRTVSLESRRQAREQVESTARGIAAIYGGSAQVDWNGIASPLVNDPTATEELARFVAQARPDLTVKGDRPLSLAGDDMAELLLAAPGAYAYLGTAHPDKPETHVPIHNGHFQLDEDALAIGAWLYAAGAAFWLEEREG